MIDSDYIRRYASDAFVKVALRRGDEFISIPVRAVEDELKKKGFPSGRTPMVCSALGTKKFQTENGIVLDHWDGPAKRQSTTVVFHYRVTPPGKSKGGDGQEAPVETPSERAKRLCDKLSGLMREEIMAHGGTEGFMRWVRSEEDDDAA
jgi:hypothetical protein